MKITKKVGKFAMAGAIAFGGLGLGAISDAPLPGLKAVTASAATSDYIDYNGVSFHEMQYNAEMGGLIDSLITRASYTTGATLGGIVKGNVSLNSEQLRLYEIPANGLLKRWKTVTPTSVAASQGKAYQYVTLITSVYPKGNYVAIHSYNLNGSTHEEYKRFTIN